MFVLLGACRLLTNYKPLFASHIDKRFCYWKKNSIKWVHSVHQFKQKRPFRQINQQMKKPPKSDDKGVLGQKYYTRDTIRNISNILRYSTWDSAQEQLKNFSVRWDSYMVNQVLKTHPPLEKAWLFFNWASELKGFKHDQFTYTTMLDIFGEARRISSMRYVFQQMQEKGIKIDVVTYTSLLHWLSNDGDVDGAMKIWKDMKANHCNPTVVSFTAYMKVLFDHNREKEAAKVYKEMLQSGCSPNCCTYTVLMEHLASSGKYKEVIEIFNKMQEVGVQPDKATCNILIQKCCKTSETWAMTCILRYMRENSLVLRYPVYLEALKTLKIAGESDVLLRQVNPHFSIKGGNKDETEEFNENTTTDINSVIDGGLILDFLRRRNFVAVDCLLAGIVNKNTLLDPRVISTIIEVNSALYRPSAALLVFQYSVKMGIRIEKTAYLALLGVFIRTNSFPKVVDIVDEMVRAGISLGTYLGALLIYKLGCAKKPDSSAKIFDLLPDDQKNTATYTALISTYFFSGKVDEGLNMFATMKSKGIRAALGTFNVILAGLEKRGRVSEVEQFRKEKKNLQADGYTQDLDEMICNRLFAADVVS
ncbi:pentatricopeptide repeat-containing protein At2g01390 isoform X1 [Actinidia eriantha]|uniref:pentatricopeptide repeat-containing protein At2g01390 isoform X1 n=2 Tax=Actinidia eriantha TaxID=165200 RepID=UPI00258F5597|nr:pentatricopeptide repeat-containing protein At2g01390 isoform X1 [Actinidia eriantha]